MIVFINSEELKFKDIDSLINYLNNISVQEDPITMHVVHLNPEELANHDGKNFTAADFTRLASFINKPAKNLFFIQFAQGYEAVWNETLADLCLLNQRQKSADLAIKITADKSKNPDRLRKAKVDMVSGEAKPDLLIERQQQQQQQQQQQTTQQVSKRASRKPKPAPTDIDKDQNLKDPAEFESLVDRYNINVLFPDYADKVDLIKIWDDLIGEGVERLFNTVPKVNSRGVVKRKEIKKELTQLKITHVDLPAMSQIIRHYQAFCYGVVPDNLPQGFYLEKTTDDKHILCYSTKPEKQHHATITPLTVTLKHTVQPLGSYKQFILMRLQNVDSDDDYIAAALAEKNPDFIQNFPTTSQYKKRFIALTDPKSSLEIRKQALWFFMEELLRFEKDDALINEFSRQFEAANLDDTELQGLAHLMIAHGAKSVILFLQTLIELKEQGLYSEFKAIFLKDPQDYTQLGTAQGLKNLKKLMQFNDSEQAWWDSLVKQHHEAGNSVDFNDLFNAFDYFVAEVKKMGLKLPLSCPVQNIRHMKVALDRTLAILKNAGDRNEQMVCLYGLDYGPFGAYLASNAYDFQVVSKDMNLSLTVEGSTGRYAFPNKFRFEREFKYSRKENVFSNLLTYGASEPPAQLVDKKHPLYNDPLVIQLVREWQCKDWVIYVKRNAFESPVYVVVAYDDGETPRFKCAKYQKAYYNGREFISLSGFRPPPFLKPHQITELDYNPPLSRGLLAALENNKKSLVEAWYLFYRFVGKQESAYSIEIYQKIEQLITDTERLNEIDMRRLMAIAAVSTTTASSQLLDPVTECAALIEKITTADEKYRQRLAISDPSLQAPDANIFLLYIKELKILSAERVPSLREIIQVVELVEDLPAQQLQGAVDFGFKFLLNYQNTPEALAAVIKNIKTRLIKEKGNSQIKGLPFLDYQGMLMLIEPFLLKRFSHSRNPVDKSIFGDDDKKAANFITLMSCISDDLGDLNGSLNKQLLQLAKRINRLPEPTNTLFLELMASINVAHSYALPSLEELNALIAVIEKSPALVTEETAKQEPDRDAQRTLLLELITQQLPLTKIGQDPINESLTSLISIVKDYITGVNPFDNFNQALDEIPDIGFINVGPILKRLWSEPLVKAKQAYDKLILTVNEEPLDADKFFVEFDALQAIIFAALNQEIPLIGKKVGDLLTGFIKKTIGDQEIDSTKLLQLCWQVQTLLPLLQSPFEKKFNQSLDSSIKRMQLCHHDFDGFVAYLRKSLGQFDISQPFIVAVTEYSDRFNTVNGFTNALIRLKKQDEEDYLKVIKKLDNNLHHMPLNVLAGLLDNLRRQKDVPVSDQIQTILAVLRSQEKTDPERLAKALQQLTPLIDANDLSKEAYLRLLQVSFKHNLSKDSPFPLEAMIALKATINNDHAKALFNNLVRVINGLKPDVTDDTLTDTIEKIKTTITTLMPQSPQVVQLIANLLACCQNNNQQDFNELKQFLQFLPQNMGSLSLMNVVLSQAKTVSLQQMLDLQQGLSKHAALLPKLSKLFNYRPYPQLEKLLEVLKQEGSAVEEFSNNFDTDPNGGRAGNTRSKAEIIKQQFSTKRVHDTVVNVQDLLQHSALSTQQQYSLAERLVYINAIGKDYPFSINGKRCENLTQTSREMLYQYWVELTGQLNAPGLPDEAKNQLHLKLLALLREMFFRATGKFPRTSQLLSVLLSLDNPQNLLMEIDTGEGKSITTALLAVMQFTQGGTVDVCTANQGLVFQDYYDKGAADFFSSLGIKSAVVRADSPAGTYQKGGINYSTIGDVTIYRQRAKVEGENILDEKGHHLLLDEVDSAILDERTLFNYAIGGDGEKNPHAWIYPLINQFIDQADFRRLLPSEGRVWSEKEDLQKLKIFIDERATTLERKKQLLDLTDRKWNKWLNAACTAYRQKEGTDFIIHKKEGKDVYVAVPLTRNVPQYGASYSHGVQQFLQARLQQNDEKGEQRIFPIAAEMEFVASESAKDSIDFYYQHGRIIGISGTVGNEEELAEQRIKFAMQAFRVPPHKENKRIGLGTVISQSTSEQINTIKHIVDAAVEQHGDSAAPVLLVCKDIHQARQMEGQLTSHYQSKGITVQLVTGEETEEARQLLIDKAGKLNTLTISTSLLGRGTDIDPQHEDGLLVIQAYLDSERTTRQVTGRAARNGKVGRYVAIYDVDGLPHHYETQSLMAMTAAQKGKALTHLQQQINEEGAVQRHYLQEVSGFQQVILAEFDRWQAWLESINEEKEAHERSALQKDLSTLRADLIDNLTDLWRAELEASDLARKFANPYIRRNAQGKLDTLELDKTLALFKTKAKEAWQGIKENLGNRVNKADCDEINQLRLEALEQINIDEQLKLRKLDLRQRNAAKAKEKENNSYWVAEALDEHATVLKYSADVLSQEEKQEYRDHSLASQFTILKNKFDQIIDKLPLKANKKAAFKFTINSDDRINCCHDIADALLTYQNHFAYDLSAIYRMQPVLTQFVGLWNKIQSQYEKHIPEKLDEKMVNLQSGYLDNVAKQLVDTLEKNLAWAEKKGWDYHLERDSVKRAAQEILAQAKAIKQADDQNKAECINALYRLLHKHQIQLKDTWVFAIGHRDIRPVIKAALAAVDTINNIPDLDCFAAREQGVQDYHMEKFDQLLNKIAKKMARDSKGLTLMNEIKAICDNNNSIYVFYELDNCLKRSQEMFKATPLAKPFAALMAGLQHEINALRRTQGDLLTKSRFLTLKEQQLAEELQVAQVSLRAGHTGFKEYFELVVIGEMPKLLAEKFERYDASQRLPALKKELTNLQKIGFFKASQAERIESLQKEIANQERASSMAIKRFDSLDELLRFERDLRESPVPVSNVPV